jgi:transcription-repair coupling factor (superfamily II helicase)
LRRSLIKKISETRWTKSRCLIIYVTERKGCSILSDRAKKEYLSASCERCRWSSKKEMRAVLDQFARSAGTTARGALQSDVLEFPLRFVYLRYATLAAQQCPSIARQGRGVFWAGDRKNSICEEMIEKLKQEIFRTEAFENVRLRLASLNVDEPLVLRGVAGSLMAFVAAAVYERASEGSSGAQVVLVASDAEKAATLRDDLELLLGSSAVRYFSNEHAHHGAPIAAPASIPQMETLRSLARKEGGTVVTHPLALLEKLPAPGAFDTGTIEIEVNKQVPFEHILQRLATLGFEKKDFVETYGDFAVRGGIVDVFPFVGENPIRLEFWGNTVESVREFDVLSQRSIKELQSVQLVANVLAIGGESPDGVKGEDQNHSLFDYLEPEALVLLDDPALIEREIHEAGLNSNDHLFTWDEIQKSVIRFPRILCAQLKSAIDNPKSEIDVSSLSQPSFNGSVDALYSNLQSLAGQGYSTYLLCDTQPLADRLNELIEEVATRPEAELTPHDRTSAGETEVSYSGLQPSTISAEGGCAYGANYQLLTESIHHGFVLPAARIAVYTEHEIFGRGRRRGDARRYRFRGFSLRELQALRRGDYVVHTDFGVGKFDRLKKIKVGDIEQEVMKLLYAENDVLYVNVNHLDRVEKYSSKEGHVPKLSRLGSGEWDRLKDRAKKRIKDIARDLIALYAARKKETGVAFSPDSHWQKELEASFIYEDTPDQARATLDVKRDMEQESPMDRLICGDVGFGKTEVAVRAAFKALLDGKQVALLVPTTILALQHHSTFIDRLSKYSVNIEMLSRFRSKKEQAAILEGLTAGKIDIIIGTHRLLSKDVRFKDLGLLIIDEEHRFGVEAKEKLRKLRTNVDTLTLTATPIPRTLHFSLIGARDLSVINTPPRNRLPIITEIAEFDVRLIRDAILKEIHRGGQVYFVHDNVQHIDDMCAYLQEHIPEARFRVAHGQMRSTQLERVMLDFLEKKFHVLVCTKIIESGLDIPNVNTIVINRADRFGMAELYQLRGRVGRSSVQAYAYLIIPPVSSLPKTTIRRLQAVEEFTELGSGFNLAMRDLEIRGTGNLLGAEQSGFIAEMGFEMYERVLEEAVVELKEQEFQQLFEGAPVEIRGKKTETTIESDLEAYIPDFYLESDTERLDIYRRLSRALSHAEIENIREELRDRFGEYPEEVENLLKLVELRLLASRGKFPQVSLKEGKLTITLPDESKQQFYGAENQADAPFQRIMAKVAAEYKTRARLRQVGKTLTIEFLLRPNSDDPRCIAQARAILEDMISVEIVSS